MSVGVTPKSIFTDKTHRKLEKKIGEKISRFFCLETSADFFVCGEIVWWDTSFSEIMVYIEYD